MRKAFQLSFSYANPLIERFTADYFKTLPENPGVYFMIGHDGEIRYIGKAKNLRKRVTSYSRLKPGNACERLLEMIDGVARIQWQVLESEAAALAREADLLRSVKPPYNVAGTDPEHYLFVGVRPQLKPGQRAGTVVVDFQLASHSDIEEAGYAVYGCFQHRQKVKAGYTALFRLIFACLFDKPRSFCYPARITRTSPPWLHTAEMPEAWMDDLGEFLSGRSAKLLDRIFWTLLENERVPAFMRPSLQEDLETVKAFYELGPAKTHALRQKHRLRTDVVSHERMDQMIARGLRAREIVAP